VMVPSVLGCRLVVRLMSPAKASSLHHHLVIFKGAHGQSRSACVCDFHGAPLYVSSGCGNTHLPRVKILSCRSLG